MSNCYLYESIVGPGYSKDNTGNYYIYILKILKVAYRKIQLCPAHTEKAKLL